MAEHTLFEDAQALFTGTLFVSLAPILCGQVGLLTAVQMGIDCTIVLLALTVIEPARVAWSVLAAVVMSLFIAIHHRPGRYAVL